MKLKKLLAFALCIALCATALVGCGGDEDEEVSYEDFDWNSLILTEEPVTFTYWVRNDMSGSVANYAENEAYKEIARRTNVDIEFIHPSGDQNNLDMMIAAGTLPDIIQVVGINAYPNGGGDQCIEDNIIIRLNELIDEYAPNYNAARNQDDESRRLTITDQGNIYCFCKLLSGEELAWSGIKIRKDLLDSLNLDVPETIDDWYDVLTAFKGAGVPIPLEIADGTGWDTTAEFGAFIGSFGVNKSFVLDESGKVNYGPIMDGYYDYLKTMNKWYEEGLLDSEFNTRDDKGEQAAAGNIGASIQIGFGDYETVACPYPSLTRGGEVRFRQKNWRNRGYEAAITTACSNPELAVKWFDYHYDHSKFGGARLFDWGIDGVSYNLYNGPEVESAYNVLSDLFTITDDMRKEGYPIATEIVTEDPEGIWHAYNKYKLDNGPYYKDVVRVMATDPEKIINENYMVWTQAGTAGMLPPYTMTTDERTENSEIMSAINSYVSGMYFKFIRGEESLDKWDEYVATVKSMDIARAIEINQAAYDRLMAR